MTCLALPHCVSTPLAYILYNTKGNIEFGIPFLSVQLLDTGLEVVRTLYAFHHPHFIFSLIVVVLQRHQWYDSTHRRNTNIPTLKYTAQYYYPSSSILSSTERSICALDLPKCSVPSEVLQPSVFHDVQYGWNNSALRTAYCFWRSTLKQREIGGTTNQSGSASIGSMSMDTGLREIRYLT